MANQPRPQNTQTVYENSRIDPYQWNAEIIEPNRFARQYDQNLANFSASLGVEEELRRFAKNQYFKTNDEQVLVGADRDVPEDDMIEDDLFLTNAITENEAQDAVDKTRYIKEMKTYINLTSAARLTANQIVTVPGNIEGDPTSTSTGIHLTSNYTFFPFKVNGPSFEVNVAQRYQKVNIVNSDGSQNLSLGYTLDYTANNPPINVEVDFIPFEQGYSQEPGLVIITPEINRIDFLAQNVAGSNSRNPVFYISPNGTFIFDFFIAVGSYTIMGLQKSIQGALDAQLPGVFTVKTFVSPIINPGQVNIQITTDPTKNLYIMTFLMPPNFPQAATDQVRPGDKAIVEPVIAPDGQTLATVSNTGPITYFPDPTNFVLNLNQVFTNVKAIRVISSEIPNTSQIIDLQNNEVQFQIQRPDKTIIQYPENQSGQLTSIFYYFLPPGDYDVPLLANTLETGVNQLVFSKTGIVDLFSIQADLVTGIFSIVIRDDYGFNWVFGRDQLTTDAEGFIIADTISDADIQIDWRQLWAMLGFQSGRTYSPLQLDTIPPSPIVVFVGRFDNTVATFLGPPGNQIQLNVAYGAFNLKTSDILWMYLNGYETIYDTYTQKSYFARFTKNNAKPNNYIIDSYSNAPGVFFSSPIPKISQFAVSMFDETGNQANLRFVDFRMVLELTQLVDRFAGLDYSSQRGIGDKTSYI